MQLPHQHGCLTVGAMRGILQGCRQAKLIFASSTSCVIVPHEKIDLSKASHPETLKHIQTSGAWGQQNAPLPLQQQTALLVSLRESTS